MHNRRLGILAMLVTAWFASAAQGEETWSLSGTKIYPAPDQTPFSGTIVIAGTKIQSIEPASARRAAPAPSASKCNGGVVVAGFQNSHVHFTADEFRNARHLPATTLEEALTRMLTRYGFTTVFDIASDRDNTLALRERIESGDVRGPRILTVGLSLFPSNGLPVYVEHMPRALLDKFPQPGSIEAAVDAVRENIDSGTDGIKLFIATPQGDNSIKRMPMDITRAAVSEAHRRGKLVFAHPTDIHGVREALDAGVDILAHPPLGAPVPWPEPLFEQVRTAGMSMIPTLKLLQYELQKQGVPAAAGDRLMDENTVELGKFAARGGQVLFGTDVGYMTDYDPTLEYELLAKAGLSPMQILASLTSTPAARWNEQSHRGRLASGLAADIVVLDADPADSPRHFAAVRCAIRQGEIVYAKP